MADRGGSRTHFAELDGLRAVSALSILVFHCCAAPEQLDRLYGRILFPLRVAVPVFFLISGFLLYRPMFRARWESRATAPLREYAKRRIVRIVPAYWLALTVGGLLLNVPGVFGRHWWMLYGFAQVYSERTRALGIGPAWSLCNELAFYALLPVLAAGCAALARWLSSSLHRAGRRSMWQADVIVLFPLGILSLAFHTRAQTHSLLLTQTLPATFQWFVPGMLLAVATVVANDRDPATVHPAQRWIASHAGLCWVAAGGLFLLDAALINPRSVSFQPYQTGAGIWLTDSVLQLAIATLMAAPLMLGGRGSGLPGRWLALRVMAWLGVISYGIYLWHRPLLLYFQAHGISSGPVASVPRLIAATGAVSLVVGAASWYVIERPLLVRFTRAKARREA